MPMINTLEDAIRAIEWQDMDVFEMEETEINPFNGYKRYNLGQYDVIETYDDTKQYPNHFSLIGAKDEK